MNDPIYNSEASQNIRSLLQTRAVELYRICDLENKGFINKKDIQRMQESLGLTPELLEEVFESLDTSHNGYLTIDEFTKGFSHYLSDEMGADDEQIVDVSGTDANGTAMSHDLEDTDILFKDTMESLGASNIFDE
jgi:hypothetical protein